MITQEITIYMICLCCKHTDSLFWFILVLCCTRSVCTLGTNHYDSFEHMIPHNLDPYPGEENPLNNVLFKILGSVTFNYLNSYN